MLLQLNNPIYFQAPFTSVRLGKTGLSVTVNVWRNGTALVTGATATEVGDGLYSYTLTGASASVAGSYVAVFKTTDSTVDSQVAYSLWRVGENWVQNVDATISSRSTFAGGAVASVAGNVGGNVVGSVGSVSSSVNTNANATETAIKLKTDNLPASPAAVSNIPLASDNATAVWASGNRSLTTFGTLVADIWANATRTLSDKIGFSLSSTQSFNNTGQTSNIPAQVKGMDTDTVTSSALASSAVQEIQSGLSTQASLDSLSSTVSTQVASIVASIKAKTDNLPLDPADASDIATSFSGVLAQLATLSSYVDTEVAAIKSKTDNIPELPASKGDVTTASASIITSIDGMNDISTQELAAALAEYDGVTRTEATADKQEIIDFIESIPEISENEMMFFRL